MLRCVIADQTTRDAERVGIRSPVISQFTHNHNVTGQDNMKYRHNSLCIYVYVVVCMGALGCLVMNADRRIVNYNIIKI